MSEPVILGSESPDADVLVYDKDAAYYEGLLVDNGGDILVDSNGNALEFEYVSEA
ncbi:MAG: hypothetical protein J6T54_12375 [Fibrobacter sp.]|nr:hypothetical protein [Fibrobacter sp.]